MLTVESAAEMEALGARLAKGLAPGMLITLDGDLGAGKTTLVRGLLRALGHEGPVRSPTFTLVEPYDLDARRIRHFDLYRVADPGELEYIGLRDYLDGEAVCLVEWPGRGEGQLPAADIAIVIEIAGAGRRVDCRAGSETGRKLALEAGCGTRISGK